MRYIVDRMPQNWKQCEFAEWEPYPPFIEEPRRVLCQRDGKICDLYKEDREHYHSCRYLKELET